MDLTPVCLNRILWSVIHFISGGVVMIVSSVIWINFTEVYRHTEKYDITVGDVIATSGQTFGQMEIVYAFVLLCTVLRDYVKLMHIGLVGGWYLIFLGSYDLIDIFFINPFEVSVPKFLGFVVATVLTIIRLKWITKA